jgi:hypothetical protein
VFENIYKPDKVDSGEPYCRHPWGGTVTIRNEHRPSLTTLETWVWTNRKEKRKRKGLLNCCQIPDKFLAIFRGMFEHFRGVSNSFFIYFTISRRTLKDILRNLGGETLLYPSISVSVLLSSFLPSFLWSCLCALRQINVKYLLVKYADKRRSVAN